MAMQVPQTPMLPMFQDAAQKIRWAQRCIRNLADSLNLYIRDGITCMIEDALPGENRSHFVIDTGDPVPTALVAGDIIRNMRAALDHAVAGIYRHHGKRDDFVYFPIANDRAALANNIKCGLEENGFSKLTPFFLNEVNAVKDSPIWLLNRIDRANKHRTLVIVEEMLFAPMPDFSIPGLIAKNNQITLKLGQKIRYPIPAGVNMDNYNNSERRMTIIFGPSEVFGGQPVIQTLHSLCNTVVDVVVNLQAAYVRAFPA